MKVDRNIVSIKKLTDKDNGFVDATPRERVGMVWELTKEAWYIKDKEDAEQRLQRDVVKLIRKRG